MSIPAEKYKIMEDRPRDFAFSRIQKIIIVYTFSDIKDTILVIVQQKPQKVEGTMGKQIVRFSRWSCRSLFQVYSRIMTLIFALFCVASGQLPRTSSNTRANETANFKGTAYRASDSTALKNVRLFLSDCFAPAYGIYAEYGVIVPWYGPAPRVDTITTDENGHFEKNLTGSQARVITSDVVDEQSGRTSYQSSGCILIQEGVDSSYTLYLHKQIVAVEPVAARTRPEQTLIMTALQGNLLQVYIPELKENRTDASIINSKGQRITVLTTDNKGTLSWDTRGTARGVYFLKLCNKESNLNVKILVK